jgi:hypothetical protein
MGNQLFQYAFAHLISKKLSTKFLLDTNWVPFDLHYFKLKFPYNLFSNGFFFKVYNYLQKKIRLKKVVENMDCTEDISDFVWTNGTDYIGFFQEGGLYREHKKELQQLFQIKDNYVKAFEKKYASFLNGKKTVVISVRLGDYRKFGIREYNNASMLMPLKWYKEQIIPLEKGDYNFFFISDELETVKKELTVPGKQVFYVEDSVINQFQLLLNADVCIISNSTFAWWGAFLNHKEDAVIIAPKYFCGYLIQKEYPKGIQNVDFKWV